MRACIAISILLVACATQAPRPATPLNIENCDPAIPSSDASNIKPPKIIRRVAPKTPAIAGTHVVEVESIIDETGHISSICSVSGDQPFVESIITAMRQWTFEPATLDGKPVKVRFKLTSSFRN